ncbi:Haloacid dehalogenase-like hydrolase [Rhodotorula sp. JG-1b]|nr:Haloacid dehalogenase-like hydrolase [Rhodotorula sp. JG-1b]
MSFSPTHPVEHAEFDVEGVLFDMDGTLVDSIKAVEAAWGAVAKEIGQDPEEVIAATHGRRAIDNLRDLKPKLRRLTNEQMEPHVEEFEKKILKEADEFGEKVRVRRASESSSRRNSASSSRRNSRRGSSSSGRNPLLSGLAGGQFGMSSISTDQSGQASGTASPKPIDDETNLDSVNQKLAGLNTNDDRMAQLDADPFEDSDEEDSAVRILPGVRRLIDSLPTGRWAVATSGAKTYCHGALARAGIKRPKVTITADDPRLTAGKPDPAPFLLAAKELGIPIEKCVVFEDSPSGIKAGVASGARTIAICTSHPVEKINSQGAHYIVPSLDCVHVKRMPGGRLRVVIDGT